uniref:Glucose-6-phosphate isomerase n=1 Tax=uncultured Planctomycetota bacterium TaxID=120965 RepID=H5SLY9_9BACT|nr:glucose-6-phosphate isomerase [uncultured Planctomycetota bacterium]
MLWDFRQAIFDEGRPSPSPRVVELRSRHYVRKPQLDTLRERLAELRQQIEHEALSSEARALAPQPADHGFINLPAQLLEQAERHPRDNLLVRIQHSAAILRELADRIVILGIGGSYLGARALTEALLSTYHNELAVEARRSIPRCYFEGNGLDNDTLADLLALLQPPQGMARSRQERTALVVVSKSGTTLETAAAFRILWRHWQQWHPRELAARLVLVVTETQPRSRLYQVAQALGLPQEAIFPMPDDVGGRFSVFTPAGLVPAAILGLDISQLLRGAADMTRHFWEHPVEQNLPLQFAALNHLFFASLGKPIRVLSVWSKKLEGLGLWYDQLVSESLGKNETGPTPITAVQTRDLHSRGQQHQEGARDRIIHNVIVERPGHSPIPLGQLDGNTDGLDPIAGKTVPELLQAAWQGTNLAYAEDARPTTDLVLPQLDEYTLGQLMQMLMLSTVIEGRLLGVNPYGQPGVEAYKRNMRWLLALE